MNLDLRLKVPVYSWWLGSVHKEEGHGFIRASNWDAESGSSCHQLEEDERIGRRGTLGDKLHLCPPRWWPASLSSTERWTLGLSSFLTPIHLYQPSVHFVFIFSWLLPLLKIWFGSACLDSSLSNKVWSWTVQGSVPISAMNLLMETEQVA